MNHIEHANIGRHSGRSHVIPPTLEEHAEAARRGHPTLSSDTLHEIRADVAARIALASGSPAVTIARLQKRITDLESVNTKLKIDQMNADTK